MGHKHSKLGTPKIRAYFRQQRCNARARGIEFLLTLEDWFEIWTASGYLHLRGRHKGEYVMSRHGDQGAYEVGNVSIKLASQNCSEGVSRAIKDGRIQPCQNNCTGKGKGWTLLKRGHRQYYQVAFRDKYVGIYKTQTEAESAYRSAYERGI